MPGVTGASVNLATETATVRAAAGTPTSALRSAIEGAGYGIVEQHAVRDAVFDIEDEAKIFMPVTARYEEISKHIVKNPGAVRGWWLWRGQDIVETRSADGAEGELWKRVASGGMEYTQLYQTRRQAVVHYHGDLRASGNAKSWNTLNTVIDDCQLSRLTHKGNVTVLDRKGEKYAGVLDGIKTEIWWLPKEQLLALVRKTSGGHRVELRLRELRPLTQTSLQMTGDEQLADYRLIDFADLGDMKYDPFVKAYRPAKNIITDLVQRSRKAFAMNSNARACPIAVSAVGFDDRGLRARRRNLMQSFLPVLGRRFPVAALPLGFSFFNHAPRNCPAHVSL